MAEAGADPRYVMGQIGHRRAEFTLAVSIQAWATAGMPPTPASATFYPALIGHEWAQTGRGRQSDE